MVERNGFRFDFRINVPEPPDGQEVVKCYGMPLFVYAAKDGEVRLASGLTESQQCEVAQYVQEHGVAGVMLLLKRDVARGRVH